MRSRWEKFALAYKPFFRVIQIRILSSARITRNITCFSPWYGGKTCVWRNQRRAALAAWVRCGLSSPRRDSKTGVLLLSSRRRNQPFLQSHCRSEDNRACLSGLLCNASRGGATRSEQAASCSRNPNLAPNSNVSEPLPSTIWTDPREDPKRSIPLVLDSSFRDRERSLDPGRLRRALRHLRTNGTSALGSNLRHGKVSLAFLLHTVSFDEDRSK